MKSPFIAFLRRQAYLFVLVCFVVLASVCPVWGEPTSQANFIAKVIEEHKKISDSFISNSVVLEGTSQDIAGNPSAQVTLTYRRLGMECFSYRSMIDNDIESVSACNSQYEFILQKSVSDKSWRIMSLNPITFSQSPGIVACDASWNKFQYFLYIADVPLFWLLAENTLYEVSDFQEVAQPDKTSDITLRLIINNPDMIYRDHRTKKYAASIGFETVEIKFNIEKYGYIPYEYTFAQHGNLNKTVFSDFTQVLGAKVPVKMSSSIVLNDGTSWTNLNCAFLYEEIAECKEKDFSLSNGVVE